MDHARKNPVEIRIAHYAESHMHPTNELIHLICVPAIMWTLLGLIWTIHPYLAVAVTVVTLIYYFTLSSKLFFGMLIMTAGMLGILYALPEHLVLPISIIIFIIAWTLQFIGHYIEGKKPSFFEDIRYLLIGPLFVLGVIYRKCGIQL